MKICKFVLDVNFKKKKQKEPKKVINKCYSSMISVQNGLKTPIKRAFYIKIKLVDGIDLFKQKQSIKIRLIIFLCKNH